MPVPLSNSNSSNCRANSTLNLNEIGYMLPVLWALTDVSQISYDCQLMIYIYYLYVVYCTSYNRLATIIECDNVSGSSPLIGPALNSHC